MFPMPKRQEPGARINELRLSEGVVSFVCGDPLQIKDAMLPREESPRFERVRMLVHRGVMVHSVFHNRHE